MIALDLQNIKKSYGANEILSGLQLTLKEEGKVALIGKNGCGKTTLFKLITGEESLDEGLINLKKNSVVGYLSQIPSYPNKKAWDVLNEAFESLNNMKKAISDYEKKLQEIQHMSDEKILHQYGSLLERYELEGGYEISEKLSKITQGLQLSDVLLDKEFEQLSGGEKTRIMLGKLLLESPTILLLDEPTNHLDLEMIQWLENFLKDYKQAVLMISHDRYFLDAVVTEIYELANGQVSHYYGNYSKYVEEKEQRLLEQAQEFDQQQKKIKAMEESIKRFRDWGARADNEKMFIKAKQLEKRIDKMDILDKPTLKDPQMQLKFEKNKSGSKEILSVENLDFSYDQQSLFKNASARLFRKERVALMGSNGSGKSTLIKLLLGEIKAQNGRVYINETLKVGYMAQEIFFENPEFTVLEMFKETFGYPETEIRRKLARFLFLKEDVHKKIASLSGGEKVRFSLCMMVENAVDLLILDEPTNHVDIASREMLEEALDQFEGALMFISHDRYFIKKIARKIWAIEAGQIHIYDGDYDYYQAELDKRRAKLNEPVVEKKEGKDNSIREVKSKKTFQNPIDYEALILDYEEKKLSLEISMADFSDDYEKLMKIQEEIDLLKDEIEKLYITWLE